MCTDIVSILGPMAIFTSNPLTFLIFIYDTI